MATLQHVCSTPIARAVHSRAATVAATIAAPSSRASRADPRVLVGMAELELQQLAMDFGQQKYRGRQLHQLLYKTKVKEFHDISHCISLFMSVPQAFRSDLREAGWRVGRSPVHEAVTAADGTIKILLKLEDNRLVETVGIPVEDDKGSFRLTACVSSQVLSIEELFKHRVTNVVFIGMGEPMLNLKSVLGAHKCLNKNLRESIIPSAKAYPLDALMEDCQDYFLETGRRVSFEYTLLAGINDGEEHAIEFAELIHKCGHGYHVNLIPYNPIEGSEYRRPYKKVVLACKEALESRKTTVTVRQTCGLDASAACGQLRNDFKKTPLQESSTTEPQPTPA